MKYKIFIGLLFLIISVNADTLTYTGDKELCITNITGNITCIQKIELYTYDADQEYLLEIIDKPIVKESNSLLNFMILDVIDIAFTFMLIMLIIGISVEIASRNK